jgi:hypothetical protein
MRRASFESRISWGPINILGDPRYGEVRGCSSMDSVYLAVVAALIAAKTTTRRQL